MTPTPRFGLGFRTPHFAALAARPPGVDWLELLSDNFLGVGGPRRAQLERLRSLFPVALHGVGLGIANDAPPRREYLSALRELADFVQPELVSDHLCWTGLDGATSHDLLPVPAQRALLNGLAERVARVQDALGRRLVLENASAYVRFRGEDASEAELLAALCDRTGCGVLLDVNNLFVNAANLGTDPAAALAALRPRHVAYMHVAGHAQLAGMCVDTHGAAVPDAVWALFRRAVLRFPDAHVMLERDDAIPPLPALIAELDTARAHWRSARADGRDGRAALPAHEAASGVALCSASPCDAQSAVAAQPSPSPRGELASAAWGDAEAPEERTAAPAARDPSPVVAWPVAQRAFWRAVVEGARDEALAAALDDRGPVAAERGLRVYRDAYATLAERVLGANFPALARALGRRDFAALCAAFQDAHAPQSSDFVSFGAPLAEFVERFALVEDYAVPRAALADIARVEHAEREAQEAGDAPGALPLSALAALPPAAWERARFRFAPSFRVLETAWDVLPALRALAAGDPLPLPERVDAGALIVRVDGLVRSERIERAGARALGVLARGACFAHACEAAGGEEAAADVARALARAAAAHALCAIEA